MTKRQLNKAKSRARGAYSLAKMVGRTDRHAHGLAQYEAEKIFVEGNVVIGDKAYKIADYAEIYWHARNAKNSGAASERLAELALVGLED